MSFEIPPKPVPSQSSESKKGFDREKLKKALAGPMMGIAMAIPDGAHAEVESTVASEYVQMTQEKRRDLRIIDVQKKTEARGEHDEEMDKEMTEEMLQGVKAEEETGEQERSAMQEFKKRFLEREFSSEKEVFEVLREAAREYKNEFFTVYGVKSDGSVKISSAEFQGKHGGVFAGLPEMVKILKKVNEKVVFAHTHPLHLKEILGEVSGESDVMFPPSLPDVRTASELHWLERYDPPDGQMEEIRHFESATESLVVDGKGVWKFKVDFFHPFMDEQRRAAAKDAAEMNRSDQSANSIRADEAESFYAQIANPDVIIKRRAWENAPSELQEDMFSIFHARMAGTSTREGFGYEYTNEQVKVANAKEGERENAVKSFLNWCKERGIEMNYLPF